MKRRIASLLAIFLVAALPPVHAQDGGWTDEQREALDTVIDAVNNMIALDSYAISGQSSSTQNTQVEGQAGFQFSTEQSFRLSVQFDANDLLTSASGSVITQSATLSGEDEETQYEMSSQFSIVDGTLYELYELPPLFQETVNENQSIWRMLSYDDLQAVLGGQYGTRAMAIQSGVLPVVSPGQEGQFTVTGTWTEPFLEEFVLDIVELEPEEIDGQAVRVFEITYDPLPLMMKANPPESELSAETIQALAIHLREDIQQKQRVWIGVDDGLLHRNDTVFDSNYSTGEIREAIPDLADSNFWPQDNMTLIASGTSSTTYSDFDVPLVVQAPPGAVPLIEQLAQ